MRAASLWWCTTWSTIPFASARSTEMRPELVDHYHRLLEAQRAQNLELRELLGGTGTTEFDPDTVERLRTLGYIQ